MRADWRFLLPWDQERAPIIRVPDGRRAAWMVDDGWAVAPAAGDDSTAAAVDAVAVEEGPELARLLSEERPSVLVVWRPPVGPRQWLSAGRSLPGYETVSFLPVPSAAAPKTYLPLHPDARSVLIGWFADRLPGPSLLAAFAARAATVIGHRREIVQVARRLEPAPADQSEVTAVLEPGVIVTTSGHDEGSRAVRLRLPGPAGDGTFGASTEASATGPIAEKFVNRPRYASSSAGEQAALARVHEALPASLASAVPQPLGVDTRYGATRAVESLLPGPTMAQALGPRSSRRRCVAALDRALAWFDDLHQATAATSVWSPEDSEAWLRTPLAALAADLPSRPALTRLVDRVAQEAEGRPVATVLRHYDPGPWNLILGDRLGVIDWENHEPRPADRIGLALCDHQYLITYWRHLVVGSTSLADEQQVSGAIVPSGRRRRWAVEEGITRLRASADRLGVDRQLLGALWVHNWLEQAAFTSARRPDRDPGRVLTYLEWAAEELQVPV